MQNQGPNFSLGQARPWNSSQQVGVFKKYTIHTGTLGNVNIVSNAAGGHPGGEVRNGKIFLFGGFWESRPNHRRVWAQKGAFWSFTGNGTWLLVVLVPLGGLTAKYSKMEENWPLRTPRVSPDALLTMLAAKLPPPPPEGFEIFRFIYLAPGLVPHNG